MKRDRLTKGWTLPQLCIYPDNGFEENPAQLALHLSQYESADPVALVVHRHQHTVDQPWVGSLLHQFDQSHNRSQRARRVVLTPDRNDEQVGRC